MLLIARPYPAPDPYPPPSPSSERALRERRRALVERGRRGVGVAISDHVSAQSEGERFPLAHVLCRSTDGSFLCKAKVSMPCTFVLGRIDPS